MADAVPGKLPNPDLITGKGTILKAALAYVETLPGPDPVKRLTEAVDDDTRKMLSGMVLASTRYPLRRLVNVFETADRVFGRGDLALCWEMGRLGADFEVKMLHKLFLQAGTLDYWLRIAGSTWRLYYNAGKLTAKTEREHGTVRLTEFNPISKAFCYRFGGWVRGVVELSKGRNVTVRHTDCVLDGKPACVWEGTWSR